jgi:DNA-directed RNA polymerase subunit N (RpoN/RPB10)
MEKCHKCGESIPENWNRHNKCGLNIEESEIKEEVKKKMSLLRRWKNL